MFSGCGQPPALGGNLHIGSPEIVWSANNYAIGQNTVTSAPNNCYITADGVKNHIEIRLSQQRLEVLASDAGLANFRLVGSKPAASAAPLATYHHSYSPHRRHAYSNSTAYLYPNPRRPGHQHPHPLSRANKSAEPHPHDNSNTHSGGASAVRDTPIHLFADQVAAITLQHDGQSRAG